MEAIIIVGLFVLMALIFEYSNGFHDAANALATTVSTRALSPKNTIIMGVTFEFLGAVIVVHLTMLLGSVPFFKPVTDTIGKIVHLPTLGSMETGAVFSLEFLALVVGIGLLAAFLWNVITWKFGIPSSSSHALIGGVCGASFAAFGTGVIQMGVVMTAVMSLIISPLIAIPCAYLLMKLLLYLVRHSTPDVAERFRKGVIISSAAFAFAHGANDGQKTMGIIALFLLSAGMLELSSTGLIYPPLWVILACSLALALGVGTGGWKIMKTVGSKIFKMKYEHGFNAQTTATAIVLGNSFIGLPVSTTHVITTAIMGTGAAQRISAVKWGVGKTLLITWLITIPMAFIVGAIMYAIAALIFGAPLIF
ncbi:MAG: anion permease [Candidatus Altiarchaeales archaeon HGW-Altiarchaeales-1]|nr:MAG: anion permease [Candidatus Altiarchaeales archaeon HGW-Altiarchaeales-1]